MKGVSVLVTIFLFVAAAELGNLLNRAGLLPADKEVSGETWERSRPIDAQTLTADHAMGNSQIRFARYESLRSTNQFTE
jgi:hypothetical protein